ncbi:MAG: MATE family efflux transporter [Pseudomonadota bacterium]
MVGFGLTYGDPDQSPDDLSAAMVVEPAPRGPAAANAPLRHRDILTIAVPIILSNATTPLVGYVDLAVIGTYGSTQLTGAMALAAQLFNFIFWTFGFLRMGTTGLTAQAAGAGHADETAAHLGRALLIGTVIGIVLIVFQGPIAKLALWAFGASEAINALAMTYYDVRIWSAPLTMMNYALLGWFIGLGRAGRAFAIQLLLNGVNIVLAIALTIGLGYGMTGVAASSVVAEAVALAVGLWLAMREIRARGGALRWESLVARAALVRAFNVNRDLMIRTLALEVAFGFFLAQGARAGDLTLAANGVLQAIITVTMYLLDGFAFAAETLTGQAIGARARPRFDHAVWLSTAWAGVLALLVSAALWVVGPALIDLSTRAEDVREAARLYLFWAALVPIAGVWCFQLDGIFIGATRTAAMRNMMLLSLIIYLAAAVPLTAAFGNHGLWLAFLGFFGVRALTLLWCYPALIRDSFATAR